MGPDKDIGSHLSKILSVALIGLVSCVGAIYLTVSEGSAVESSVIAIWFAICFGFILIQVQKAEGLLAAERNEARKRAKADTDGQ